MIKFLVSKVRSLFAPQEKPELKSATRVANAVNPSVETSQPEAIFGLLLTGWGLQNAVANVTPQGNAFFIRVANQGPANFLDQIPKGGWGGSTYFGLAIPEKDENRMDMTIKASETSPKFTVETWPVESRDKASWGYFIPRSEVTQVWVAWRRIREAAATENFMRELTTDTPCAAF